MSPDEKIKYAAKRSAGDAGSAKQPPAAASTAFSIVGPADVAVLALGVGVWLYVMLSFGVPLLSPPPAVSFVAVAAGVAPSQLLLYPLVWYNSKAFAKACKKRKWKPVPVFARLVALGKVLQQVALLAWIASLSGGSAAALYAQVLAASPLQWAAFAALVTMGQVLNGSVYKAIGADGVYYGFKLGAPVPWSTAFPFSAGLRHPQYVGGYCSQLGVFALFASKATIAAGLVPLAGWWAALYVLNSVIEASDDNDAA